MTDNTEDERTEPRQREYHVGGTAEEDTLQHLRSADIAFIDYLDAWIDKCLATGTLPVAAAARYREAIAARCAELGEVPHVREHIAALKLKAGDILAVIAPVDNRSLMEQMGKSTKQFLEYAGVDGVQVVVFPRGTEIRVLDRQSAVELQEPAAEEPKVHIQIHGKPDDGSAATSARIRAVLAQEVRRNALYGRGRQ